jgi:mono/diheme cytochrome c family protein
MRPVQTRRRNLSASAAIVAALAACTAASEEVTYDPLLAELGQPVFERYCVSCHGASAHGDGPVAQALRPPPADLTRIAQRRGGKFPGGEIARTIDGRFGITAHGPRAMPVWGERFGADVPDAEVGESVARGRIATLVEYLKAIQEPTPPKPRNPTPGGESE